MRFLLIVLWLSACHPRLAMGVDPVGTVRGPMSSVMSPKPDPTALTTEPTPADRPSAFTLSVGGGARDLTVAIAVHGGLGTPEYTMLTGAIDLRWTLARWRGLSAGINVSPTRTLLVARDYSELEVGSGVRGGGGIAYTRKAWSVYADYYRGIVGFGSGPAEGTTTLSGLVLGVAFQP